ncbi:MAG TPA: SRPBCC family protein [Candidatus Eisenbacteria bacterium]|nr:SRPBCC family protein [Candidatus Eisenbacteria bacterium]
MNLYAITIEIQAPLERVWEVMRDAERWPEWTPSVTRIRREDPGELKVGSRAWIHQPGFPPALWRVTELEPGRSFTWITGSAVMRATARHSVEPAPEGCRAILSVEYSGLFGWLLARLTAGVNDRYLSMEANGLKARCEDAATPGAAG